jgi:hypothetical protein
LEFPDGTTPIASKVILYSSSNNWQQAPVPPLSKILAEYNANNSVKYGKAGRRDIESVVAKVNIEMDDGTTSSNNVMMTIANQRHHSVFPYTGFGYSIPRALCDVGIS